MFLLESGCPFLLAEAPLCQQAVGISVEFVSHITHSFAISTKPTRLERATEATVSMGSAVSGWATACSPELVPCAGLIHTSAPQVFAGVAMTNLPGILVLGLAKAQLIQIFFFRLNLLITGLGLLHGLVFLPVILSYLGECPAPPTWPDQAWSISAWLPLGFIATGTARGGAWPSQVSSCSD